MADNKKSSQFGLGLLVGALAGALAGIFYAPKSGKQNRKEAAKRFEDLKKKLAEMNLEKKVKEIFGSVTAETKELYFSAAKELLEKVAELKERVHEINPKKYQQLVDEVIEDFKSKSKQSLGTVSKLKRHLLVDWNKLINKKQPSVKRQTKAKSAKSKAKSRK